MTVSQEIMAANESGRAVPLVKAGKDAFDVEDPKAGAGPAKGSAMLFVSVFVCCVSPILFGFSLCFTSPAQLTMTSAGASAAPGGLAVMTKAEFSTYASMLNVGAVVGAFAGAWVSDFIGRKKALALTAAPHIAAWFATSVSGTPMSLTAARVLVGIAVGMGSSITPCYIGEIAPLELRGSLGAANQLSVTTGILLVNVVGSYATVVEHQGHAFCQWRQLALVGAALAAVLFGMLPMPESPKWLAQRGNTAAAKAALARLRAGDCAAEQEALVAGNEANTAASFSSSGDKMSLCDYKKSLVICVGIMLYVQLSGINALLMYTNTICKRAGMNDENASTLVVVGLQVLLTGVSVLIMDKFGRRTLLASTSLLMCAAHLGLAAYYHWSSFIPSWFALASLGLFMVGFSIALGPIPWLLTAEIFPTKVLGSASSIATAINWGASFIVTKSFDPVQDALGGDGIFFLFAMICLGGFAFVQTMLVETKGRTVDEVIAELHGGARAPRVRA